MELDRRAVPIVQVEEGPVRALSRAQQTQEQTVRDRAVVRDRVLVRENRVLALDRVSVQSRPPIGNDE